MHGQLATVGNFHLAVGTSTTTAPWHDIVAAIDLAAIEALLQERPDGFIVLGREREVAAAPIGIPQLCDDRLRRPPDLFAWLLRRNEFDFVVSSDRIGQLSQLAGVIPFHPVTEPDRLLGLNCRVLQHSTFAFMDELVDPELFDFALGSQSQLLFDFHFNPQALAVESVLVAKIATVHCPVTLERVFVGASPCMMDPHRIVGRDWPIQETPGRLASNLIPQFPEDRAFAPELQDFVFPANKFRVSNFLKHQ